MNKLMLCLFLVISLCIPATVQGRITPQAYMDIKYREEMYNYKKNNLSFRKVRISGKQGNYMIKGEVKSDQSFFYYSVEDGHYVLMPEQRIKRIGRYPGWSKFKIKVSIAKERLPDNGTLVLHFYNKIEPDNMITNVYPIILERFYNE